ncbi:hypothetical protein LCGC14_1682820, partial [marine sediment metagenome]
MNKISYRARARELGEQIEDFKRDIKTLEDNLEAAEESAMAMERERDELLETVNRNSSEQDALVEFWNRKVFDAKTGLDTAKAQIRRLGSQSEARAEDFEHLDVLADGYKSQRDDARSDLATYQLRIIELEETLRRPEARKARFQSELETSDLDAAATLRRTEKELDKVIMNLREQVAALTIDKDGLTFERDGLIESGAEYEAKGARDAKIISNLRSNAEGDAVTIQHCAD